MNRNSELSYAFIAGKTGAESSLPEVINKVPYAFPSISVAWEFI